MNTKDVLTLALIGGAAWYLYRLFTLPEWAQPLPAEARGNHDVPRQGGDIVWNEDMQPVWDFFKSIGQIDPLSEEEAAEVQAVVDVLNKQLGYDGWGTL